MTPLQIEMLLHYHCSCKTDYNNGDFNVPAVQEAIDWFLKVEVLKRRERTSRFTFELTLRGKVYVERLINTPLPEYETQHIIVTGGLESELEAHIQGLVEKYKCIL